MSAAKNKCTPAHQCHLWVTNLYTSLFPNAISEGKLHKWVTQLQDKNSRDKHDGNVNAVDL